MGNLGSIPGEENGYPLQYSGLENPMDYPWDCKELDMTEQLSFHFTSDPGMESESPKVAGRFFTV